MSSGLTGLESPVFLVHPNAGGGSAPARLNRLLQRSAKRYANPTIIPISSLADAAAAASSLESGRVAVAVGGDGTVAMVAAALLSSGPAETPLAILPLGTGNLMARNLGFTSSAHALHCLQDISFRRIDVMTTSHPQAPVALVSISGGFEGHFIRSYSAGRLRLGRPVAAVAAIAAAGRSRHAIRLELDGRAVINAADEVFSAGLYNTRCYAGGLVMSPDADLADGWCEAVVYSSAATYLAACARAMRDRRRDPRTVRRARDSAASPRPDVVRRRWRSAIIECDSPLQIDGESVSGTAVAVSVEPQALAVVVPP